VRLGAAATIIGVVALDALAGGVPEVLEPAVAVAAGPHHHLGGGALFWVSMFVCLSACLSVDGWIDGLMGENGGGGIRGRVRD
jgi:hypothetical protein